MPWTAGGLDPSNGLASTTVALLLIAVLLCFSSLCLLPHSCVQRPLESLSGHGIQCHPAQNGMSV